MEHSGEGVSARLAELDGGGSVNVLTQRHASVAISVWNLKEVKRRGRILIRIDS